MTERPKKKECTCSYDPITNEVVTGFGCECGAITWNACCDQWEDWLKEQPKDAVSVPTLWNIIYETLQKDRKSIKTLQLLSPEEIDAKLTHKIASSIARKLKGQDNEAK